MLAFSEKTVSRPITSRFSLQDILFSVSLLSVIESLNTRYFFSERSSFIFGAEITSVFSPFSSSFKEEKLFVKRNSSTFSGSFSFFL